MVIRPPSKKDTIYNVLSYAHKSYTTTNRFCLGLYASIVPLFYFYLHHPFIQAVHLSTSAKLTLSGLPANTLLTLNANHDITTIPTTYSKTATSVDAYLHNVRTDNLHSAVFSAEKASVNELTLVSESGVKSSEIVNGAILVQNKVCILCVTSIANGNND